MESLLKSIIHIHQYIYESRQMYQQQLNEITESARFSFPLILAYIVQYISERTLRVNLSAHQNLKVISRIYKNRQKKRWQKTKIQKAFYLLDMQLFPSIILYAIIFYISMYPYDSQLY